MFLWTAFMVGLVGSLHCVGMCGPIAMALPYQGRNKLTTAVNVIQYNAGRVITYALLGGLIGLLGEGLFLAGMQRAFSVGAGVLLLLAAILSLHLTSNFIRVPGINRMFFWLKSTLGRLINSGSSSSLLVIGMLNGLLPCGLVYLAIVGAMATGSVIKGMSYMALFGIGTIPLLLVASVAGTVVSLRLRRSLQKLVPVFLVVFAVLLILRGLNFEVPVNFSFWEATENQPMCH